MIDIMSYSMRYSQTTPSRSKLHGRSKGSSTVGSRPISTPELPSYAIVAAEKRSLRENITVHRGATHTIHTNSPIFHSNDNYNVINNATVAMDSIFDTASLLSICLDVNDYEFWIEFHKALETGNINNINYILRFAITNSVSESHTLAFRAQIVMELLSNARTRDMTLAALVETIAFIDIQWTMSLREAGILPILIELLFDCGYDNRELVLKASHSLALSTSQVSESCFSPPTSLDHDHDTTWQSPLSPCIWRGGISSGACGVHWSPSSTLASFNDVVDEQVVFNRLSGHSIVNYSSQLMLCFASHETRCCQVIKSSLQDLMDTAAYSIHSSDDPRMITILKFINDLDATNLLACDNVLLNLSNISTTYSCNDDYDPKTDLSIDENTDSSDCRTVANAECNREPTVTDITPDDRWKTMVDGDMREVVVELSSPTADVNISDSYLASHTNYLDSSSLNRSSLLSSSNESRLDSVDIVNFIIKNNSNSASPTSLVDNDEDELLLNDCSDVCNVILSLSTTPPCTITEISNSSLRNSVIITGDSASVSISDLNEAEGSVVLRIRQLIESQDNSVTESSNNLMTSPNQTDFDDVILMSSLNISSINDASLVSPVVSNAKESDSQIQLDDIETSKDRSWSNFLMKIGAVGVGATVALLIFKGTALSTSDRSTSSSRSMHK